MDQGNCECTIAKCNPEFIHTEKAPANSIAQHKPSGCNQTGVAVKGGSCACMNDTTQDYNARQDAVLGSTPKRGALQH